MVRLRIKGVMAVGMPCLLIVAGGCSVGPNTDPYPPSATERLMYAHFRDALDLQAGAIYGDLDRLNDAGDRLRRTNPEPGLPPGSERFLDAVIAAATAAAEATTPSEGRVAAARVAKTCGACHQAYRVGPDFIVGGPVEGDRLSQHMARQNRIARLLWNGVLGPSEETWRAGAAELESEPPFPREVAARVQDAALLVEARAQLRAYGESAGRATTADQRTAVLAQVWGVCASCHQVAGARGVAGVVPQTAQTHPYIERAFVARP